MGPETVNKIKNSQIHGDFVGRDQITNIIMFLDSEREFVVTRNANIKPVSYFTGRETELQELRQRIEEGRKSVLVSGMGGIGKTNICRKLFEEYLKKHADGGNGPFQHIGYIEYDGDMGSSLLNCLRYKEQANPELNQEAAWKELQHLAADGKLLLFVDNVDKAIGTDPGLQRLRSIPGAVVLTSRQASFSDEFEPYQIGFLDMEQCKEIYEKIRFGGSGRKADLEEFEDLKYIIENLAGRHTITVELLAHLARTKLWSVKRLREELEEKGFRLTFRKNGELINIQESYEKLYDLSELTEAEQNILEAFSVFPYIPLAAETCNEWLLVDAGVSEDDDILMGLCQKGWLQLNMGQVSYDLHPVFAQFICEKCKPKMEKHAGLIGACQKCLQIPESGSALECQQYIPFAESILEKIDMGKGSEKDKFLNAIAYLLKHISEYKKAGKWYQESLRLRKDALGEDHAKVAVTYNELACVYSFQGKYSEAETLFKKSIQINKKVLGEEHLDIATNYNNLAEVYRNQEKYSEAEELFEKSLQIRRKVLGEEHLDTACSYNNLANVYIGQEKYSEAKILLKKSLQINGKILGKEHQNIATIYNNLANLYYNQEKYSEAEDLLKKSIQIGEKALGEEHLNTVISYNNLAGVYERQGKYAKAIIYYLKAYKILLDKLGIDHPHTQIVYESLELTYSELNPEGNFEQWLEEQMNEAE